MCTCIAACWASEPNGPRSARDRAWVRPVAAPGTWRRERGWATVARRFLGQVAVPVKPGHSRRVWQGAPMAALDRLPDDRQARQHRDLHGADVVLPISSHRHVGAVPPLQGDTLLVEI